MDFDNVVPGEIPQPAPLRSAFDRFVTEALAIWPDASRLDVRLYGGWLEEGLFTNRGSQLQASIGSSAYFPFKHPRRDGLLRGEISLATRLAAVPGLEWGHTLRVRTGMPRIRFRDGAYPLDCVHRSQACPLRAIRQFSKSQNQACATPACSVTGHRAIHAPEQKMVDVMLACDTLALATRSERVLVLSSDLDVLPALAMARMQPGAELAVLRTSRFAADLYEDELRAMGVHVGRWEGA